MPSRVRLPSISLIVARSYPGNVIGYENKLPWHIKSDLIRFKEITTGHAIIMGRTTFESIGRPLPNRTNVVMSRNTLRSNNDDITVDDDTNLYFSNSRENAMYYADIVSILRGKREIFIIGGSALYKLFDEFVSKVYLTQVFGEFNGDAHFETKFPKPQWRIIEETDFPKNYRGDDYPYRFSIIEKRNRRDRYKFVTEFFTSNENKDKWVAQRLQKKPNAIRDYIEENLDFLE